MANTNTPFKELPDNILFSYNDFKRDVIYTNDRFYNPQTGRMRQNTSTLINTTHIKTFRPSSIRRRITRDRLGMQETYTR